MDVYLLSFKGQIHSFFQFLKFLSSHMACGILVLHLGLKPVFQHWKRGVLTTGPPGKSQCTCVFTCGLLGPYMFGHNLQKCVITKWLNWKEKPISQSVSFTNKEMIELRGWILKGPTCSHHLQWVWSPRKESLSLFPLFSYLFAMNWWDWMPWSSSFEYWVLSQHFHSPLSPSSRGSLIPLCFLS